MKATLSSHILDSVSGKSAVGIRCVLSRLNSDGTRNIVFDVSANEEGRIIEDFEADEIGSAQFELEMYAADYFIAQSSIAQKNSAANCVEQIVIRFKVISGKERYHMPIMLSPHSYSTWWSS